jgi:hypothetical protein
MNRKEADVLIAKQDLEDAAATLLVSRKHRRGYYIPHAVEFDKKNHQNWLIVRAVMISAHGEVTYSSTQRFLVAQAVFEGWTLKAICDEHVRRNTAEAAHNALITETLGVESLRSTDVWAAKSRLEKQVLEALGLDTDTSATFSEYCGAGMEIKLSLAQVREIVGLA